MPARPGRRAKNRATPARPQCERERSWCCVRRDRPIKRQSPAGRASR